MRKLTYEEKPRVTLRKSTLCHSATFISPSGRIWRGTGPTQLAAWYALERLMRDHQLRLHMEYIRRNPERPDIGLGASDDYKATSNLPWWRRLFRI